MLRERKLNLACGKRYLEGWANVDISRSVRADYYRDLNYDLFDLWDSETIEVINARACLSHLPRTRQWQLMQECWQLLQPGGLLFIMVPYGDTFAADDPTHHGGWIPGTIKHFTGWAHKRSDADYGGQARFEIMWEYQLLRSGSKRLWRQHAPELTWDEFLRLHSGCIDALSWWLRKPGVTDLTWKDVDRAIVDSGLYGCGYWSNHKHEF